MRSELKVLIICENKESGKYAKELGDHLLLSLQSKIEITPDVWTFAALQHPQLQESAAEKINETDIILFSTSGNASLPATIKRWLEACLAQSERPRALAVLFGPAADSQEVRSTRHYLEEIATKRALDFFV